MAGDTAATTTFAVSPSPLHVEGVGQTLTQRVFQPCFFQAPAVKPGQSTARDERQIRAYADASRLPIAQPVPAEGYDPTTPATAPMVPEATWCQSQR